MTAVAVVLGFAGSLGLATYGLNKADGQADQAKENAELRTKLAGINADVVILRDQLARLEAAEKSVRLVFGFPEIDPAERALGVGGTTPLQTPLTEAGKLSYGVENEIDRLMRRCAFERQNYETVFQSLMDRKVQLDHTPSILPVDGSLARGFGIKPDPFTGQQRQHSGLDLAARYGTPIFAPASGTVILREFQTQFGNLIAIDHGYGIETYYGHLSKFNIKPNQVVRRGDVIGYVGNSGHSTGPHLHYEVHVKGSPVNPLAYIYDRAPELQAPLAATPARVSTF